MTFGKFLLYFIGALILAPVVIWLGALALAWLALNIKPGDWFTVLGGVGLAVWIAKAVRDRSKAPPPNAPYDLAM